MIATLLGALGALASGGSVTTAQVAISQTIVVRTRARGKATPLPPPATYKERKGPACIDAAAIAGAAVMAPNAVDFILKGGQRMRARLEDACPELDYYRGFYVSPSADSRICADRDAIRTRSGGECQIDRFRKLLPVAAKPPKPPAP
jgi:hypothetical protein